MPTSAASFNDRMDAWTAEQRTPWGQLKYTIVQANLRRHLPVAPLHILDAGGGNGHDSIPFAVDGHHVTIVDYASAMLDDAQRHAAAMQVQQRVTIQLAEVSDLPALFPQPCFDAVFCHNVLQYADDSAALLAAAAAPLKPGGLLSIISINRYSSPYHAAFLHGDLVDAYARLDRRVEVTYIFGTPMQQYAPEEIIDLLPTIDCALDQYYGIRCICDYWGDNEQKADPTIFAQLEQLELALTNRHPYKHLARYFQIVAHKR